MDYTSSMSAFSKLTCEIETSPLQQISAPL
jgi:hypothetical protein